MAAGATLSIAAISALTAAHWIVRRRTEHHVDHRFVHDANGVIAGAESLSLLAGEHAALILHGFGDTPQSVADLALHLHNRGWTVRAPLLPGHGRALRDFARVPAGAWLRAAQTEFATLRRSHPVVVLIGQSLGGALATVIGADEPHVRAIVLLAPYLVMLPRVARLARWQRLASIVAPYVHGRTEASIWNPLERAKSLGFGVTPTRLLGELASVTRAAWLAAPRVVAPVLMMQSRSDNRIRFEDAEATYRRFGSATKEFVPLEGCGHVIAVDYCRDEVFTRTEKWLEPFIPIRLPN
jgi:carboxylesterase